MLVLTRKIGQRIKIGENIVLQVVRISKGGVQLGIAAPRDVPILREEIIGHQKDGDGG